MINEVARFSSPAEKIRKFFISLDQWELDGGESNEVIEDLVKLREDYKINSSGWKFINEVIELVKAKD